MNVKIGIAIQANGNCSIKNLVEAGAHWTIAANCIHSTILTPLISLFSIQKAIEFNQNLELIPSSLQNDKSLKMHLFKWIDK